MDLSKLSGTYRIEEDPQIPGSEEMTWPFEYRVEVTRDENDKDLYNVANDVSSGGEITGNFIQIRDNRDGTYNLSFDEYGDGNFQSFDNVEEDVLMHYLNHLVNMDTAVKVSDLPAEETSETDETLEESKTEKWTDVYKQFTDIVDNDKEINPEKIEKSVKELYEKHKGELAWDEAYRRWNADEAPDIDQHHPGQYADPKIPLTPEMQKQIDDYFLGLPMLRYEFLVKRYDREADREAVTAISLEDAEDQLNSDGYVEYWDYLPDFNYDKVLEESEETSGLTMSSLYETFDGTSESLGNILDKLGISKGELTSFVIPSSVKSIDSFAFSECKSLESITIPDSVTSIGNFAFYQCKSLASITIPDSVTYIGGGLFEGCSSLESITIPDSVMSIGNSAFDGCTSLKSITIPDSITSIVDNAFNECSSLESITIPDSVTSIGNQAFSFCVSLKSITIPNSVTSIGNQAFRYCVSLKSITIPDSVTSIDYGAFYNCRSLKSITIPDSVTSIDDNVFRECGPLVVNTNNKYVIDYCKKYKITVRPLNESVKESYSEELKVKKLKEDRFDPNSNRPAETLMKELDARGYDVRERIDGRISVSAIRDVNGNIYSDDEMKSKFRVEVDGWTPEKGDWETEFTADSREELYEKLDREMKVKKLKESKGQRKRRRK